MVNHHPGKFGDHRHCGSGDIMFLVVEEQYSTRRAINPPLLFISRLGNTLHIMIVCPILVTGAYSRNRKKVCPNMAMRWRKRKKLQERLLQSFLSYTQTQ